MFPEDTSYAIRLSNRASSDIHNVYEWMEITEGISTAAQWRDSLYAAVASLSRPPVRPLARENALFKDEVRVIQFRRTPHSAAYRVLFRIVNNGIDVPFVELIAVRHGAQDTITADEARQIEEGS